MVTIENKKNFDYQSGWELRGLSSEMLSIETLKLANAPELDDYVKKIPNGSTYYCIDNGSLYMYDAENKQWYLQ